MLTTSLALFHGKSPLFVPRERLSRIRAPSIWRPTIRSISRSNNVSKRPIRAYSTANGATVEGTRRFFSQERQDERLEQLKARVASKRILDAAKNESDQVSSETIDVKPPLTKHKVNKKTGWTCGSIGYGTYRNSLESMEHQQALEYALQTGAINVVDCGVNYGIESEAMVGLSLNRLFEAKRVSRDEIIVVDKIGPLIQGRALDPVKQRAARGRPFQNIKFLTPELGFCLDPEYIDFQITRSLKSLQLDTIDLLMIDTPELLLPESPSENVLGQLYRWLQGAMKYLEEEVERGRIQYYGLSSASLTSIHRAGQKKISLDMLLRTANTVGEKNHFAAISYPMNLLEPQTAHNDIPPSTPPDSIVWSKQGRDTSVQLVAYEAGLLQMAHRVLNTMVETKDIFTHIPSPEASVDPTGMMYRFVKPPVHPDPHSLAALLKATINGIIAMEKNYAVEFAKYPIDPADPNANGGSSKQMLPVSNPAAPPSPVNSKGMPHPREFVWAQIIIANLSRIDLETIKVSWEFQMKPRILEAVKALRTARPDMDSWASNYERGMTVFAEQFRYALETNKHEEIRQLEAKLEEACPALIENTSLPSKAVRIVSSTLVTTTLVGARSEQYIDDIVYGGGSYSNPHPMTPLDPSILGALFDVGAAHNQHVRSNIRQQLEMESEAAVNKSREEMEARVMSLGPRDGPRS